MKKLRTISAWILVSLVLQFGGHSFLNCQAEKVMGLTARDAEPPVISQFEAIIPGAVLANIQVSYAKDYLAYTENNTLKVFNLKQEKLVFARESPLADQGLGVLMYQWLPDRSSLLYFYAKKNPNQVTTAKIYPAKSEISTSPTENTEDSHQAKTVSSEVPLEPKPEKPYRSPIITELHSLEFPNSDEDTAPDDQLHPYEPPSGSEDILEDGKVGKFVISTSTNLIWLTVLKGSTQQLMKISIMKKVSTLNKSGELIDNMSISERYGTLYLDSKVDTSRQVVAIQYDAALNTDKRLVISKNINDRILGIRNGKVYIGEVKNDVLLKIKSTPDLQVLKENPSLKTEWEGTIPMNKNTRTLVGVNGRIIVYDHLLAHVVRDGQLAEVKLSGEENYISADGVELVQLTKTGASTLVQLHALPPAN